MQPMDRTGNRDLEPFAMKDQAAPPTGDSAGKAPKGAADALSKLDRSDQLAAVSSEMTQVLSNVTKGLGSIGGDAAKSLTKAAASAEVVGASLRRLVVNTLSAPIVLLMKVALVPLRLVQSLVGKAAPQAVAEEDEEDPVDWDEELAPKDEAPKRELKDFNDMLEKNIVFYDNQKLPLYSANMTRGVGSLGRQQQQLIMEMAQNAIRECGPLTAGMPPIPKGRFAGKVMEDVLGDVSPEDIKYFLTFAYKFASSYSGKNFRLSETYATWIMNGAPDD
jgi:hypothetical protein